jgi:hypothetical protein
MIMVPDDNAPRAPGSLFGALVRATLSGVRSAIAATTASVAVISSALPVAVRSCAAARASRSLNTTRRAPDAREDGRSAVHLDPGAYGLAGDERSELWRFDHDGGAGEQRRDRVDERERQREAPRGDDTDHGVSPVGKLELLVERDRAVRAWILVRQELLGMCALAPIFATEGSPPA